MNMGRTCVFLGSVVFFVSRNTNQMMRAQARPEKDGLTRKVVRAHDSPFSEAAPLSAASASNAGCRGNSFAGGAISYLLGGARGCAAVARPKCECLPATDRVCALPW